jgi:hypothetical protein
MPKITSHPSYLAARVALAPGTSPRAQRYALEAAARALPSRGMRGMGDLGGNISLGGSSSYTGNALLAPLSGVNAVTVTTPNGQVNVSLPSGTAATGSGQVVALHPAAAPAAAAVNSIISQVKTGTSNVSVPAAVTASLVTNPAAPNTPPTIAVQHAPTSPAPAALAAAAAAAVPALPVVPSPAPTPTPIPVAILPAPAPVPPPPAVPADGTVCTMADGSIGAYLGGVCQSTTTTSTTPVAVVATPVPAIPADGTLCTMADGSTGTTLGGVCQSLTSATPVAVAAAPIPADGTTCSMADGSTGTYLGGVCTAPTPSTPVAVTSTPATSGLADGSPCTSYSAQGTWSAADNACMVADGTPCVANDGSNDPGTFSGGQCWWTPPGSAAATPTTAASGGLSPMMQLILTLIEARYGAAAGAVPGAAVPAAVPDGTPCTASDGTAGVYQSGVCASSSSGALYGAPAQESF